MEIKIQIYNGGKLAAMTESGRTKSFIKNLIFFNSFFLSIWVSKEWNDKGREFQSRGATVQQDLSPRDHQQLLFWGPEAPGSAVWFKQLGYIHGGLTMESTKGQDQNIKVDTTLNREPV